MKAGDLVEFWPKSVFGDPNSQHAKYCTRIENRIGEHTIGLILEASGESYVVIFGINRIVLHGSFLKKTILY